MKKIYKYILMLPLAFTSCDVLDQEPEDLIATDAAIVDRSSATSAVNGLYHTLQHPDLYGGNFIMATEMAAGNGAATAFQAFWEELASGRIPASNFYIEDNWIAYYNTVNASNQVISAVPKLGDISDSEKKEMLGTAHFLRGLAFFDLLRQYGEFFNQQSAYGIPLPIAPASEPEETKRSSVAQSYEQIEADLKKAINLLPDHSNNFYASKAAAQGLLARAHLYQNEYQEAASMATAVITNGNYALPDDYNNIYLNEDSEESIFELNFIALEDPNVWAAQMYFSPPEVSVNQDLIEFFDARNENERGEYFVQSENNASIYICTKYGSTPEENGGNTIVLRLSEMHLIRAEALGRSGNPNDALDDINEIRNRAGLVDLTNISSESELLTILLNERRAEFAFEGHYWFDMVRYDRMQSIRGLEAFRKVFPIPQRDLNISDDILVQNPGY